MSKQHNVILVFGSRKKIGLAVALMLLSAGLAYGQSAPAPVTVAKLKTRVNPKDGLTYVYIPKGSFEMGCSPGDTECNKDDSPAHKVTLTKGFWIGKTAVTQAAYVKVFATMPVEGRDPTKFTTTNNPSKFKGDLLPVEHVTWYDADLYCTSVGMRLATDAEWEYAARGGSTAARYGNLDDIAWYKANSDGRTHEVAQKQPSGYGLYDTIGNIPEWVSDWSGPFTAADAVDPKGPDKGTTFDSTFRHCDECKVLRGGALDFEPARARITYRHWLEPWDPKRNHTNGFRCVSNK